MKAIYKAVATAGFLVTATQASAAQLIVNGGFEAPTVTNSCCTTTPSDPLPGWTVTSGDVNVVNGAFPTGTGNRAFEGSQYLDLIGQAPTGAIQQSFATRIGETYTVSFAYAHNLFAGLPSASANYSFGNVSGVISHTGGTVNNLGWTGFTGSFVATSTSSTLAFSNLTGGDNAGVLLDAVSVTGVVPEPSTWALLILGFGLTGGAMRRCSRAKLAFA